MVNLKFRTVIDQMGVFTYNAAKIILDYLELDCKNEYSINDIQKDLSILFSITPLQDNEKDVS